MKFIWEESDIRPGRKYTRPDINEVWMIGYVVNTSTHAKYVSVSMNDGMVTTTDNKSNLADVLTKNNYVPVEFILK